MNNKGDFAIGLLIGGALGAALALLYAPQSGSETRESLKKKGEELKDTTVDTYGKVRERATEVGGQLKDKTSTIASTVREKATDIASTVRDKGAALSSGVKATAEDIVEAG